MNNTCNNTVLRLLSLAGVAAIPLVFSGHAQASSSSAGSEFLSNAEAAPPNIIFVLDLSDEMEEACGEAEDSGDTGGDSASSSADTCLEDALDAIDQLTQHYDWAYFAVVGTSDGASNNWPVAIAPLGSSHSEISAALDLVSGSGTDTRNLGEVVYDLANDYIDREDASDSCPSWASTSYVTGEDFCGVPVQWACQETHIITITAQRPKDDYNGGVGGSTISPDIKCTWITGITTGSDTDCIYDNIVTEVYDGDYRSDLDGDQNIITHTIAIKVDGSSIAEAVFGNSVDQISNEGIYTVANSGDEILGRITTVMSYIRSGYYSRSAPTLSVDGERIVYSFYEISGDNPLAEGHVRAYKIDTDPTSSDYGTVVYDGDTQFGGAQWDAGDLLVSRPVATSESNEQDRDGFGKRDIYTFIPEAMSLGSSALKTDGKSERRMDFDADMADSVVKLGTTFLDLFFDTSDSAYNLDKDSAGLVDEDDMQALVDFTRGLPTSEYRYIDQARGTWKLGDSPHSIPVIAGNRDDIYTADSSYRAFLTDLDDQPQVVFIAANDGMLHAFRLYDDTSTTSSGTSADADEAGEELWAWIPAYLLYEDHSNADWAGNLTDMMWYGRTFLFDGSPVVEDVWIDDDGDGKKAPDGSEWRRVIVVQQGKGGPVTLALDITDPTAPEYLWEQTNETDPAAMGYTTSRPVIANLYNQEDTNNPGDSWSAIWGGGRAVPYSTDADYYKSSEANLYFWHIADDHWATSGDTKLGAVNYNDYGSNGHPEDGGVSGDTSTLKSGVDSDATYEYAYISGALAAVDLNSDGDVDVIYFPVTTAYEPTDMGDVDGDGDNGVDDLADPGFTWMYKAIIDISEPDNPEWCEFYDPNDDLGVRPEVYYSATTAWHTDGSLGVYWGTGSPYDRESSDYGYFFAVTDETPSSCSVATTLDCQGNDGYYKLRSGEGLTGNPVVYAGTVYFSTYEPAEDRCDGGTGRIYGLSFEDCEGTTDLDGDGVTDEYVSIDGYPSAITISDTGTVYYGASDSELIGELTGATDPFGAVITLGMRDVF